MLQRIREIQPRLVVFGHIHEGRGDWRIGRTRLANVTLLDAGYSPCYPPWECELENKPPGPRAAAGRRDAVR